MGVALLQPGYLVFKIPEIFAYELCRKAYINCTDLQYETEINRYEDVRGAMYLSWLYLLCATYTGGGAILTMATLTMCRHTAVRAGYGGLRTYMALLALPMLHLYHARRCGS